MNASKSKGSELERMVREATRDLMNAGIARLWKIPTDLRLTKTGLIPGEPMPADFFGIRYSDGKSIFIECKDVARSALPLGKSPGLTPFQLQAIDLCRNTQGIYILVWRYGKQIATFRMHLDLFDLTKKSLRWDVFHKLGGESASGEETLFERLGYTIMRAHADKTPHVAHPVVDPSERLYDGSTNRRAGPPPNAR